MNASTLKLIAYGKVLANDEQKASEHNLKEGDFIVAMVQKAKKPKKEEKKEEEPAKPATTAASTAATTASNPPAQAQPAAPT